MCWGRLRLTQPLSPRMGAVRALLLTTKPLAWLCGHAHDGAWLAPPQSLSQQRRGALQCVLLRRCGDQRSPDRQATASRPKSDRNVLPPTNPHAQCRPVGPMNSNLRCITLAASFKVMIQESLPRAAQEQETEAGLRQLQPPGLTPGGPGSGGKGGSCRVPRQSTAAADTPGALADAAPSSCQALARPG